MRLVETEGDVQMAFAEAVDSDAVVMVTRVNYKPWPGSCWPRVCYDRENHSVKLEVLKTFL